MLKTNLLIAFRNLRKSPLYAGLNVSGLGIGLGAALLIALYVQHELSFDRWNPQADRILRAAADINFAGQHYELAVVSSVMAPDAARQLPEIQSWCRFRDYGSYLVRRDGEAQQNIREEKVLTVDSTFFEVFPLKILEGNPGTCLTAPRSVALSKSRAEKYFSSPQLALGKTLVLENKDRWLVTAVFEDMPSNSHFQADLLLSMNGNEEVSNDPITWASNNNFQTYFLLRKGADPALFRKKFAELSKERIDISVRQMLGTTPEEFAQTGQYARFYLQNLTDIHLHSNLTAELSPNGSIKYVWIFSAIAAFILLIACINFMNLATARSAGRAREIGVRKALGGRRAALVGQFLGESLLITALAVGLALAFAALALPWYRSLTGRELALPLAEPGFWLALAGGTVLVSLLAGSYPAFFLSAYDAVRVLKGEVNSRAKGGKRFRSALVVFQFSISVSLIVATLLVYRQLQFIQQKKLGFDKNQVIILDDAYALGDKIYSLKDEMLRLPAVKNATVSGFLPIPSNRNDQGFSKVRAIDKDNTVSMQRWRVDNDYLATLGMEITAGRSFDPARVTDSTAVIINETAARRFGFADPIGQKIYTLDSSFQPGKTRPEDYTELTVIGVVKDFHFESLHSNIRALCLQLGRSQGLACFRFDSEEAGSVIATLEKNWKSLSPGQPFSYRFLDDAFDRMYRDERRVGKIAGIFSLLSVLISCLGLFGLAAFTTEQRTKEIGIRKVMGASVAGITRLLASDFLRLVLAAIVIATPVAWYAMKQWLGDFAYRAEISWWIFVLAGLGALVIAFLTVSFQSIRAALADPVKSLRNE